MGLLSFPLHFFFFFFKRRSRLDYYYPHTHIQVKYSNKYVYTTQKSPRLPYTSPSAISSLPYPSAAPIFLKQLDFIHPPQTISTQNASKSALLLFAKSKLKKKKSKDRSTKGCQLPLAALVELPSSKLSIKFWYMQTCFRKLTYLRKQITGP